MRKTLVMVLFLSIFFFSKLALAVETRPPLLDQDNIEWASVAECMEATELAQSSEEWYKIKIAHKTPFIRTKKDFDKYLSENKISDTPFSGVSKKDIEKFKEKLHFDSALRNGKCYMTGLSSVYFGDLVENYKWDESKIFNVMMLFGVGVELFKSRYNRFGGEIEPNPCCVVRMSYWCGGDDPDCKTSSFEIHYSFQQSTPCAVASSEAVKKAQAEYCADKAITCSNLRCYGQDYMVHIRGTCYCESLLHSSKIDQLGP